MAKNEIVNVLTIKTEQSQQTIKGLKKEISDLKKTLDNATIGSEQFEQASKELAEAQNTLKTAMSGQKQEVTALEGSYDALVAEMAKLKKEWRATADEAKRNSLGAEIDKINTKLKGLDSTIGNNQRLVGSYAEEFKKALAEQDDATLQTRTKLESVQKVTAGLASGYAAVQGAMTLLNIENENLQKAMVKVQSAMAIAQGVGGLKDLVEGLSRAKVAFKSAAMGATVMSAEATTASTAMVGTATATKAASVAMSGFKKALIATGIGALVVVLGVVISKLVDFAEKTKKAKEEQEALNKEITSLAAQTAGSKVARIKELANAYGKLGDNLAAKKKFVKEYKDELAEMGIEMNNVNDADRIFIEMTGKYVNAVIARAKADGARKVAAKKAEEGILKLQEADKNIEKKEKISAKADADARAAREAQRGTTGALTAGFPESAAAQRGTAAFDTAAQKAAKAVETAKSAKKELEKALDDELKSLFEFADAQDNIANQVLTPKKSGGSGKKSGGSGKTDAQKAAEEAEKRAKDIAERARKTLIDSKNEELAELKRVYDEEKLLLEQQGIDTTNLTDEYTKKKEEIEEKYRKKKEQLDAEAAAREKKLYDDKVAESEKRLSAKLGGYDKQEEKQLYLNERQQPKGNGEINSIDNELAKLEGLKSITNEMKNLRIAAIEEEQLLFDESSTRWLELEQQKIEIREQTERTLAEISRQYGEQEKARQRSLAKSITSTFTSALNSASQIIGALQEGIDTTTKEGFERNKKMQIANATIQMLVGITSAIAGAFTTKSGPWDIALAAIQAATIATTGGIQIANIKKQTFDGGGGDVSAGATPTALMSATDIPVSYTRNLMGDAETEEMNKAQQVYILESEIQDSSRKVEVREQNTNF